MNPERSKLKQQEENLQEAHGASAAQSLREFATVEELLRHDASRTAPPPALADRINVSLAAEPKPSLPWWKRLFSH